MIGADTHPWLLVLLAALIYDAWLIRYRQASLSHHFTLAVRRRPIAVSLGVGYLLAHLYGVLPARGDAFRAAVGRIPGKSRP